MNKLVIFFFFAVTQLNCYINDEISFEKVGQLAFPLDKDTGFKVDYLQQVDFKGTNCVAFGYANELKVKLYDFNQKKIIKTISFDSSGEKGVAGLGGFYFLNDNQILILSYYNQQLIIYDIDKDIIIKRIDIRQSKQFPLIEPSNFAPFFVKNNKVYLTGSLENHYFVGSIKPILECDLITGEQIMKGRGLDKVENKNYGTNYQAKFDYVEHLDKFIISHSISHYLHLTDFKEEQRYLAKSKHINKFHILPRKSKLAHYSKEEVNENWLSADYFGIKYDKYRKLYYRFVNKGRTLEEMFIPSEFTMLVLNENFNIIDEIDLPEKLDFSMFFITKAGLHFANYESYKKNSDTLIFDTYQVKRVKN